jgi:hypothetical protein
MDTAKFDYFVAKYRAAHADELKDLGSRASTLAEEAEAALRQVAAERGLAVQGGQHDATPTSPALTPRQAARAAEERSYSAAGAELVHIRQVWFLWSLPLAFAAGFVYGAMAESARGTLMGLPVALIGLFALVWPLYCIYKLSRAVDPKRSVAWAMVGACFIPIIGWIAPISLVLKAGRIRKAAISANTNSESTPAH